MRAQAVLFDRDGTLIVDRPPNRDSKAIELMPGAQRSVARLRRHGLRVGVVTNQPGARDLSAFHAELDALAGPFDGWFVCAHERDEACNCRKPAPGLIIQAARAFNLPVQACVMIGDVGSDVAAAQKAGARAVLVPTPVTRRSEVDQAPVVATSLDEATDFVLEDTL